MNVPTSSYEVCDVRWWRWTPKRRDALVCVVLYLPASVYVTVNLLIPAAVGVMLR